MKNENLKDLSKKLSSVTINLTDLDDVYITNPEDKDLLVYSKDLSKWVNQPFSDVMVDRLSYGVEIDQSKSDPACKRIGNLDLHRSLPVQSKMRRCILDDNGEVVYYLHADDSTKKEDGTDACLDGTDGQVMVELPSHYCKFEPVDENIFRCYISEYPLTGFHHVPKSYTSAYQASIYRPENKLSSVVNMSADYRGGNNNAAWDTQGRSMLGKPATNLTLTEFRTAARNRKEGSFNWNAYTYNAYKTICWLYLVEYANRSSQQAFNPELTPEGFKQGGLGQGITDLDWNLITNQWLVYPPVPNGVTNILGNHTGEATFQMPAEYTATPSIVKSMSYRGLENIFGNTSCYLDGINFLYKASGVNKGKKECYVCENPSDFCSNSIQNYTFAGLTSDSSGVIEKEAFGINGDLYATNAEEGVYMSYYWCDTFAKYEQSSDVDVFSSANVGGRSVAGTGAGLFEMGINYVYKATDTFLATRLCYVLPND